MNTVLREIEEEDSLWQSKERNRQRKKEKKEAKEARAETIQELSGNPLKDTDTNIIDSPEDTVSKEAKASGAARPSFY